MLNGATSCTKYFIPITFREITLNPQIKLAIHETFTQILSAKAETCISFLTDEEPR